MDNISEEYLKYRIGFESGIRNLPFKNIDDGILNIWYSLGYVDGRNFDFNKVEKNDIRELVKEQYEKRMNEGNEPTVHKF